MNSNSRFDSLHPRFGSILGLCALMALSGASCRTSPTRVAPLSDTAVRLDLPLVRQDALYDCGLASLSALCSYWGIEIPEAKRVELAAMAQERAGLSGDELRTALRELGMDVYLFSGSLDRAATGIYAHVDAGRPLLVMLSSDDSIQHYELVLGYDEARGNLILLDPSKGEILTPSTIFEREWSRCQKFTLLACRLPAAPSASSPQATAAESGPIQTPNSQTSPSPARNSP